ncbi:tetratricopeptide repeat protein [Orbus sturtevantii]|uniref:tetratricopeptide repeat protein n=1 Tax=Orbus sturtevantii TaxID=3074109 RepID=UPI00370D67E9
MLKQTQLFPLFTLLTLLIISTCSVDAKLRCTLLNNQQNIADCNTLADSGDANAQNTLGEIYYQDALIHKGYHTKARILFEKAANQGLAKAQYNLGAIYRDEFNNFPVALSWFEKAAAQGNSDAQNSIGYIYENGSGGEAPRLYTFDDNGKNIDPELPYIEAKFAPYEFRLPTEAYPRAVYPISEYGQGVEPDLPKAFEWYQKAAAQGNALAQTNLAYFYLMGIVVDKDEKQAFKLYQQAAKQDCPPALKSLAFMYMQGLGTKEDIPKAFSALEQAYRLLPDNNLWHMINLKMSIRHSLKTSLPHNSSVFRKQFDYKDSSDEDYTHERLNYFKKLYQLDFKHAYDIGSIYAWPRPTQSIVLGESMGENSLFKERYLIKQAIQGYYETMTSLSYYYKAEEQDMPRAQLWRKYAIKMGELNHSNVWPGYDDNQTDNDDK